MKRRDEGKTSLVDFLRSLKSVQGNHNTGSDERITHFAPFVPRVQTGHQSGAEDAQLIRSAN